MNRHTQQRLKLQLDRCQVEQARLRGRIDQQVEIAPIRVLPARN